MSHNSQGPWTPEWAQAARKMWGDGTQDAKAARCPREAELVERIAHYIESESDCLMEIVVQETKHDYGVRLLKTMAEELRAGYASGIFGGCTSV